MSKSVFNKEELNVGISACLTGEKVRYDASNKPSNFCNHELGKYVTYKMFCPEVAIGMPIPRPTIRQIRQDDVISVSRPDGTGDVTEPLKEYGKKVAKLTDDMVGYVFCANSPTCGMERVKIYSPEGNALKSDGIGMFSNEIMKANPLLPCEENGRLNDPIIRENFVARIYTYKRWQNLVTSGVTKHKLMTFHSQHKYALMSHNIVEYKKLGRLLAESELEVGDIAAEYISGLMEALKIKATRRSHTNTLQHIQGYFSKHINDDQRKELTTVIDEYRQGVMPLMVPLALIKHYLLEHPNEYLAEQTYLDPYPADLKLRYGY